MKKSVIILYLKGEIMEELQEIIGDLTIEESEKLKEYITRISDEIDVKEKFKENFDLLITPIPEYFAGYPKIVKWIDLYFYFRNKRLNGSSISFDSKGNIEIDNAFVFDIVSISEAEFKSIRSVGPKTVNIAKQKLLEDGLYFDYPISDADVEGLRAYATYEKKKSSRQKI